MKVRIHPNFRENLGFSIISYWPAKDEFYISYDTDVNTLNGAKNVVLVRQTPPFYLESWTMCCYSINELIGFLSYVSNHVYYSPPVRNSYTIIGNDKLRKLPLHAYFRNWNFKYPFPKLAYVDYMISLDTWPPFVTTHYRIKCYLKNLIDESCMKHLDKNKLYDYFSEFMSESYDYQNKLPPTHKPGDVWIVKPVADFAYQGHGITVLTDSSMLEQATKECRGEKAVIQKYITDPILWEGRKFHLRVWLMITTWGKYYVYPYFRIVTAQLPYVKSDWHNKKIHDSHFKSTDTDLYWHKQDIYTQKINKLCQLIFQSIKPLAYSESKQAYHILGLDVMLANDHIYLLEVNTYPSRKIISAEYQFYERDQKWELDCVREIFNP